MSRLTSTFDRLRQQGRLGLVAYITAGDPDLERSAELLVALDTAGASVVEVGVPFSDPVADGPVIQSSIERALAAGTTLEGVIDLVSRVRSRVGAPLVLFSYSNPIFRFGIERFVQRAAAAGVDGVLVLDLPIEEADNVRRELARHGVDMIFLVSPTTSPERIRRTAELGSGFLYAVSRLGVTGAREALPPGARDLVGRIRAESHLPVALGFGICRPEQVREACRWADAAVVGSSLVNVIAKVGTGPDLERQVQRHVRWLLGDEAANSAARGAES